MADLHASDDGRQAVEASLDLLEGFVVLRLLSELKENIQVFQLPVDPGPGLKGRFEPGFFPEDVFCPLGIVPQSGLSRLFFDVGMSLLQSVDVKDNLAGFPPFS
jgi:hypothetical protein